MKHFNKPWRSWPTCLVFFLSLLSCSTELSLVEQDAPQERGRGKWRTTKSSVVDLDSLQRIYIRQSDEDILLMDLLYREDGEYRISISADAADSLGIAPKTYQKYMDFINKLNHHDSR